MFFLLQPFLITDIKLHCMVSGDGTSLFVKLSDVGRMMCFKNIYKLNQKRCIGWIPLKDIPGVNASVMPFRVGKWKMIPWQEMIRILGSEKTPHGVRTDIASHLRTLLTEGPLDQKRSSGLDLNCLHQVFVSPGGKFSLREWLDGYRDEVLANYRILSAVPVDASVTSPERVAAASEPVEHWSVGEMPYVEPICEIVEVSTTCESVNAPVRECVNAPVQESVNVRESVNVPVQESVNAPVQESVSASSPLLRERVGATTPLLCESVPAPVQEKVTPVRESTSVPPSAVHRPVGESTTGAASRETTQVHRFAEMVVPPQMTDCNFLKVGDCYIARSPFLNLGKPVRAPVLDQPLQCEATFKPVPGGQYRMCLTRKTEGWVSPTQITLYLNNQVSVYKRESVSYFVPNGYVERHNGLVQQVEQFQKK